MTELVNLTNHDVTLVKTIDGVQKKVVIKPSGMWYRMNNQTQNRVDVIIQDDLKIDVYEKSDWYANTKWKGKHFGLPSPRKNVYYIVSRIMAYHNLDRKDLLIPESSSNKETKYLYRMVIDK